MAGDMAREVEQLLALGLSRVALAESCSISSLHCIASPHGLESSSYTSAWVGGLVGAWVHRWMGASLDGCMGARASRWIAVRASSAVMPTHCSPGSGFQLGVT
jgi:hypothetical protein